jgi:hypothetical protein
MKLRTSNLLILLAAGALSSRAENASAWRADPQHPALQYRVKCHRDAATVEWRNGYPGALALKASIKSNTDNSPWDSVEEVTVAAGASAQTPLETMYCSPGAYQIRLKTFVMAAPPAPPPPPPATVAAPVKAAIPLPTVSPYVPAVNLPEVAPETLASVQPGMKQDEVERKLGHPTSKITIPEPGEFIETYRYLVANGRSSVIRFSNGVVTTITQ